jgi:hypothetical protein
MSDEPMISVPVAAVEKLRLIRTIGSAFDDRVPEAVRGVDALLALLPPVPQWEPSEEMKMALWEAFRCEAIGFSDGPATRVLQTLHDKHGLVLSPVSNGPKDGPQASAGTADGTPLPEGWEPSDDEIADFAEAMGLIDSSALLWLRIARDNGFDARVRRARPSRIGGDQ